MLVGTNCCDPDARFSRRLLLGPVSLRGNSFCLSFAFCPPLIGSCCYSAIFPLPWIYMIVLILGGRSWGLLCHRVPFSWGSILRLFVFVVFMRNVTLHLKCAENSFSQFFPFNFPVYTCSLCSDWLSSVQSSGIVASKPIYLRLKQKKKSWLNFGVLVWLFKVPLCNNTGHRWMEPSKGHSINPFYGKRAVLFSWNVKNATFDKFPVPFLFYFNSLKGMKWAGKVTDWKYNKILTSDPCLWNCVSWQWQETQQSMKRTWCIWCTNHDVLWLLWYFNVAVYLVPLGSPIDLIILPFFPF